MCVCMCVCVDWGGRCHYKPTQWRNKTKRLWPLTHPSCLGWIINILAYISLGWTCTACSDPMVWWSLVTNRAKRESLFCCFGMGVGFSPKWRIFDYCITLTSNNDWYKNLCPWWENYVIMYNAYSKVYYGFLCSCIYENVSAVYQLNKHCITMNLLRYFQ